MPDELVGSREASDITDHSHDGQCGDQPNAGDGHEIAHPGVLQGGIGQRAFHDLDLSLERGQEVKGAQHVLAFFWRQRRLAQPLPASLAEEVGDRAGEQVAVEDGVNPGAQAVC